MGFSEQVRLFATRRVVLGSVGSALHTAIFAPPGRRVIGLSHAPRINPTFRLVDVLAGNRVAYLHQPGTEDVRAAGSASATACPIPAAPPRTCCAGPRRCGGAAPGRAGRAGARRPGAARPPLNGRYRSRAAAA